MLPDPLQQHIPAAFSNQTDRQLQRNPSQEPAGSCAAPHVEFQLPPGSFALLPRGSSCWDEERPGRDEGLKLSWETAPSQPALPSQALWEFRAMEFRGGSARTSPFLWFNPGKNGEGWDKEFRGAEHV